MIRRLLARAAASLARLNARLAERRQVRRYDKLAKATRLFALAIAQVRLGRKLSDAEHLALARMLRDWLVEQVKNPRWFDDRFLVNPRREIELFFQFEEWEVRLGIARLTESPK